MLVINPGYSQEPPLKPPFPLHSPEEPQSLIRRRSTPALGAAFLPNATSAASKPAQISHSKAGLRSRLLSHCGPLGRVGCVAAWHLSIRPLPNEFPLLPKVTSSGIFPLFSHMTSSFCNSSILPSHSIIICLFPTWRFCQSPLQPLAYTLCSAMEHSDAAWARFSFSFWLISTGRVCLMRQERENLCWRGR